MKPVWTTTNTCRACGNKRLDPILSLADAPIADRICNVDRSDELKVTAPLDLLFCSKFSLAPLSVSVRPDVLFGKDYPYYSSVAPTLVRHFEESAP